MVVVRCSKLICKVRLPLYSFHLCKLHILASPDTVGFYFSRIFLNGIIPNGDRKMGRTSGRGTMPRADESHLYSST